jgi:isopentenyldiphosphate isomerase
MNYYSQKIYIAQVDRNDTVLNKIERWKTHKEGILHRCFTVAIYYKDSVLLQHRKHPVFDDVFDVTASSHQIFQGNKLQTDLTPIYSTLKREFFIEKSDLSDEPKLQGKVYYKVKDTRSEFTEHELCYFYTCNVKEIPRPNLEYAYGFSLRPIKEIVKPTDSLYAALAPWVKEGIHKGLLASI